MRASHCFSHPGGQRSMARQAARKVSWARSWPPPRRAPAGADRIDKALILPHQRRKFLRRHTTASPPPSCVCCERPVLSINTRQEPFFLQKAQIFFCRRAHIKKAPQRVLLSGALLRRSYVALFLAGQSAPRSWRTAPAPLPRSITERMAWGIPARPSLSWMQRISWPWRLATSKPTEAPSGGTRLQSPGCSRPGRRDSCGRGPEGLPDSFYTYIYSPIRSPC